MRAATMGVVGALGLVVLAAPAFGEVVDSGPVDILVNRDFTGMNLNLVTGEVTRLTNERDADIFFFELNDEWRFANLDNFVGGGIVAESETGPASLLEPGDFVGPGLTLQQGGGVRSNFQFDDVEGAYLGVFFENEATGTLHYGWVEVTLPSAGNGVITRYAYNSTPGEGLAIVSTADLTGDGVVDAEDLASLLAAWGTGGADLTGDGTTGSADLAALIASWG